MANPTSDKLPMTIRGKALLEAELKSCCQRKDLLSSGPLRKRALTGIFLRMRSMKLLSERQGMIEGRIAEIQGKLAGAEVVDTSLIKADRVVFGAHVSIVDTESEEKFNYQIVGVDEADGEKGMISILSPIARALIGKKEGETVTVQSPKGDKEFEILSFNYR